MSLPADVINSLLEEHERVRNQRYAAQCQALAQFKEKQARELKIFTGAQWDERKLVDDYFAMEIEAAVLRETARDGQLESNPPAQA